MRVREIIRSRALDARTKFASRIVREAWLAAVSAISAKVENSASFTCRVDVSEEPDRLKYEKLNRAN